MHSNDDRIHELTRAVNQLQKQLERDEHRSRRARRMTAAVVGVALAAGITAGATLQGGAVAAEPEHGLSGLIDAIVADIKRDERLGANEADRLVAALRGKESEIQRHIEAAVAAEVGKLGSAVDQEEAAVGTWVAEHPIHGIRVVLRDIHEVMGEISTALKAMPHMSRDMSAMNIAMQEMNGKMGIMSYGVDSTMGRMGRAMPFPWSW